MPRLHLKTRFGRRQQRCLESARTSRRTSECGSWEGRREGALGGCGLSIDSVGLVADAALWSTWVMMLGLAPQAGAGSGPLVQGLANGQWRSSVYQKWLAIFHKKPDKTVFYCRQPRDAQKGVFFPGSPLEGLEVGDTKPSLADCFEKCEGCCVCQCGSTTLQFMIVVFTSSSASSTLT